MLLNEIHLPELYLTQRDYVEHQLCSIASHPWAAKESAKGKQSSINNLSCLIVNDKPFVHVK
jgi:hypothetical protein